MNRSQSREASLPARPGAICRRDFLVSGVKASLCFIACDAFASAAEPGKPGHLGHATRNIDDSLHIIADYLTLYTPPAGNFPASGSWKATYDILQRATRRKAAYGHMVVTRRPVAGGITYDTDFHNRLFDFGSSLKSTMRCSADPLPRLVEWTTDYEVYLQPDPPPEWMQEFNGSIPPLSSVPPTSMRERGTHKDGVLEISTSLNSRKIQTDRPVAPQWAVLDALRNAKADSSAPIANLDFDLFHNLTSYRPHQRLRPSGVLDITMGNLPPQTFHGFYQTGIGSEPTNYWIDSQGRPLFMTEGLISAALTNIEPA
jgi:hypothetical protein